MNKKMDIAEEESEMNSAKQDHGVRCFLYIFSILFLTWIALTLSFNWQELVTGFILSLGLSLYLSRSYAKLGFPAITIKRIWYFIVFLIVLFVEVVKANLDVAYRIIHPKLPIKPGIVVIKYRGVSPAILAVQQEKTEHNR